MRIQRTSRFVHMSETDIKSTVTVSVRHKGGWGELTSGWELSLLKNTTEWKPGERMYLNLNLLRIPRTEWKGTVVDRSLHWIQSMIWLRNPRKCSSLHDVFLVDYREIWNTCYESIVVASSSRLAGYDKVDKTYTFYFALIHRNPFSVLLRL